MADGLQAFLKANASSIKVTITSAKGSTPRSGGTWMLVGNADIFETIGGGEMEHLAIQHARKLLVDTSASSILNLPLGPEIGQCCGGFVELEFQPINQAQNKKLAEALIRLQDQESDKAPTVYIFGAGHVGKALLEALSLLPLNIVIIDSRLDQLRQLPRAKEGCEHKHLAIPESIIAQARPNSAFIILSHDHAQDFLIAETALHRQDAAFVGMIGSDTKLETFRRQFVKNGHVPKLLEKLTCPIGAGGANDKRPQVIAALVAAQLANIFFTNKIKDVHQ